MNSEREPFPLGEKSLKDILGFDPVERLGQSFLVDPKFVKKLVSQTIEGADVVEIGSGPGNLTIGIANIAHKVTGLEIFPNYAPVQARLLDACPNVEIVNINALKFDFSRWLRADPESQHQVIGNIPFHISEPLLTILAQVSDHLDDITLMVGDTLAETLLTTNPHSSHYTRLSFIASIFDISKVAHVPRSSCWPVPRTDSDIISLTPKEYPKDGNMLAHQLRRRIILSQAQGLSIIKVLNGFPATPEAGKPLEKSTLHRRSRRQLRQELRQAVVDHSRMPLARKTTTTADLARMGQLASRIQLRSEILSKPFRSLNNQELCQLAVAIESLH